MIVEPKVRGFICTTAHPKGCAENVKRQIDYVKQQGHVSNSPKKVLVIGASTGYGLASRIVAAFSGGASTIGLCYEKAASGKRTASPGWYNSAEFEQQANVAGLYAKTISGDAFSDAIKEQTIALIKKDWGGEVDLVVYSLASPRRLHPKTGDVFNSVLKPIGKAYTSKTVDVMNGKVSDISIEPANEDDIAATVAVMGGEDWAMWMNALAEAGVLAQGVKTVAYSYIGPQLTYPVYRQGTIGKAKEDLEATAHQLNDMLQQQYSGAAYVSVNKALVTQASSAIPVVPLYISLLYKVMQEKNCHEGCIEQMWRLFADRLYANNEVPVDDKDRIRVDDWEMRDDVQAEVAQLWQQVNTDNLEQLAAIDHYRRDFYQLFGFKVPNIDYSQDIDVAIPIPSIDK